MSSRVVSIQNAGGPEVLELIERAAPELLPGHVLVRVAAAGLNRADVLQRKGLYPAPKGVPSDVPGLEFSGSIEAVAPDVSGWEPGVRVMGIVGGGAMATHVVVPASELLRTPEALSDVEAAAVPEAFVTAWDALKQGRVAAGETVLLHAVASGVGTAALQLVRLHGATGVGTSRSPEKLSRCEALGLHRGLLVGSDARFAAEVTADLIIDTIGAAYLTENLKALAPQGRIVCLGTLGGHRGELPLGLFMSKRATLIGSVLRSRSAEEKSAIAAAFTLEVLPHFTARGTSAPLLRPVLGHVLPMHRIRDAHALMESDTTFGKIVLTWENT